MFATELIFGKNPRSDSRIPEGFCRGNRDIEESYNVGPI